MTLEQMYEEAAKALCDPEAVSDFPCERHRGDGKAAVDAVLAGAEKVDWCATHNDHTAAFAEPGCRIVSKLLIDPATEEE